MTEASVAPAVPDQPVLFSGVRRELARIAIVNLLLTAVTLGIYRFWAKTRLRQFYWNNVAIGGDALEYTGRGVELFLGFLIALVVLAIVSTIVALIQFYVALADPVAGQAVQLVVYVVLAWLYGYAVFRARRYRLTRTLWRGIRFGQDGSPARYAWLRFGWLILLVLTLGAVRPWYDVALRRFEMANTRFGFSRFAYAGRGAELFRWWWPALIALLAVTAGIAVVGFETVALAVAQEADTATPDGFDVTFDELRGRGPVIAATVLGAVGAIGFVIFNTRYRVAALRYLFAVTSLEGVTCRSRARTPRVVLYALASGGLIVLLVGAAAALLQPLGGFGVILFLLAILAVGIVNQLFFVFPLVRHVATTVETSDLAALDGVVQATRDDPRFGEGLLDALDFDMGVV